MVLFSHFKMSNGQLITWWPSYCVSDFGCAWRYLQSPRYLRLGWEVLQRTSERMPVQSTIIKKRIQDCTYYMYRLLNKLTINYMICRRSGGWNDTDSPEPSASSLEPFGHLLFNQHKSCSLRISVFKKHKISAATKIRKTWNPKIRFQK